MGTVASKSPGETGGLGKFSRTGPYPGQPHSSTSRGGRIGLLSTLSCRRYSFDFKKKKSFPSADNTSLKIWPTYWQVCFSQKASYFTTDGFEGYFFLRVQSSSLPHLGILMGSKILISSERWQNPRTECQEPKWRPPWEGGPSHPPTQELKQLTGRQGCGGQGGQHFQKLKTLNKQKINIQCLYKLQHYETVGHITQKKNLQYLQPLILRSLEKQ